MKFLVDNALSPVIAEGMRKAGIEARHVKDLGMHDAPDLEIFEYAFENDMIIVSADTDFGTLLALRQYAKPSVVLFRNAEKRPALQLSLLLSSLPMLEIDLSVGSVVVFEDNRIRIRKLPIG